MVESFTGQEETVKALDAMRPLRVQMFKDIQALTEFNDKGAQKASDQSANLYASARNLVGGALGLAALLWIGAGLFIVRSVSSPVTRLTRTMGELAKGDLSVEIQGAARREEIGQMAQAVEVFKQNGLEVRRLQEEQEASKAQAEAERRAEMMRLADSFEAAVISVVDAVAAGDGDAGDRFVACLDGRRI